MLPFIFRTPFHTRGEAREALVAQSVYAGSVVLGQGYSGVVPSKPPALHWLVAAVSSLTGRVTEGTSRLPSFLVALSLLLLLYSFVRREFGEERAFLTAILLMFSVEWLRNSIISRVDMVLSATSAASALLLFRWVRSGESKGVPILSIALLGYAVLAKGPIALVLVVGSLCVFSYLEGDRFLSIVRMALKLTVFSVLIPACWYYLAFRVDGDKFIDKVVAENIMRFLSEDGYSPHRHSMFYMFGALVLGFLPFSLYALRLVLLARLSSASFNLKALCARIRAAYFELEPLERFSLVFSLITFCFFLIPSSKRGAYLLPMYPFLSVLLTGLVSRYRIHWEGFLRYGQSLVACLVLVLLFLLLFVSVDLQAVKGFMELGTALKDNVVFLEVLSELWASTYLIEKFLVCFLLVLDCTWLIQVVVKRRQLLSVFRFAFVHYVVLLTVLLGVVLPRLAIALSPQSFAKEIRTIVADSSLYSYNFEFYGVGFYLNKQVLGFSKNECKAQSEDATRHVMLLERDLDAFRDLCPNMLFDVEARSVNGITKVKNKALLLKVWN